MAEHWKLIEYTSSLVKTAIKLANPYWQRSDCAYVQQESSPEVDIYNENSLSWCAYLPSGSYLGYTRRGSKFRIPKRWKTAEAAMKALDKECPLEN